MNNVPPEIQTACNEYGKTLSKESTVFKSKKPSRQSIVDAIEGACFDNQAQVVATNELLKGMSIELEVQQVTTIIRTCCGKSYRDPHPCL